jgi:hypothetical protein
MALSPCSARLSIRSGDSQIDQVYSFDETTPAPQPKDTVRANDSRFRSCRASAGATATEPAKQPEKATKSNQARSAPSFWAQSFLVD